MTNTEGHFNFNPDVFCEEDKLGFNQYIRTLSGMIKNPDFKTPFCIGIYGKWGSGKTSFMRLLSREIVKEPKEPYIIPVWFNPWRYEKEEHLIIPFLKALEVELEKFADKNKSHLKDAFKSVKVISVRAGQTAAAIASALSFEWKLMGLGVSLEASKAVEREEDLVKEYKERKKSLAARLSSLYFDINETLKMSANEKEFRIVIFIDDLDRCLPEKAVNLLESVKLFMDIPGYLFVIGVDRDVIEKGIAYHYRHLDHNVEKKEDSATVKSKDYLDKMIQFPLDLPPVEYGYKSGYIKSLLGGNKPYENLAGLIEKGVGDNPRELKRFINLLAFMSWQADTIKKDILAVETDEDNKRLIEAHFIKAGC